ncbi:MAG TPA: acyltransferase [Atribacterota bacterium]|nr:acyltransferase [Atribacterota bacterium]
MINIIKKIKKHGIINSICLFIKIIFMKCLISIKNFWYLYLLNINKIRNKKVIIGKNCRINQKTYFTGNGLTIIEDNVSFGYKLGGNFRGSGIEIQPRKSDAKIILQKNISMNNNITIVSNESIVIGENCLIGHDCEFLDSDGHGISPDMRRKSSGKCEPIIIKNNVWFGNNCKILRGTEIGNNCIVAAGSIVKGKFKDNVILGGIPAKVIREI